MIESAAYDLIKQEGIEVGTDRTIRQALSTLIEAKFGEKSGPLLQKMASISDTERLQRLFKVFHLADTPEELLSLMDGEGFD